MINPIMDEARYRQWRQAKLASYPRSLAEIVVGIGGLARMSATEKIAITKTCKRANMAIYRCRDKFVDGGAILAFAENFGLRRIDHHLCANDNGVAELTVAENGVRSGYVPYSSRSLSWHTDGYYNESPRSIRAVVLHCVSSAVRGGVNALLDPEMLYLQLRDENPEFITALEHPECMTIPANLDAGGEIRAAVCGPVFSYDRNGVLHMRYSARKKNIQWRDDDLLGQARDKLAEILAADNGPVFHYRLQAGEGVISNNVLHNRTSFEDTPEQKRRMYRARFLERIESS